MRVLVDEKAIAVPSASVAAAIEAARATAEATGRLVIEVLGDGVPLGDDMLSTPPDHPAGIEELRISTVERGAFIAITLSDVAEALDRVRADHVTASDALARDDQATAVELLQGIMSAWAIASDVVQKAGELMGLDIASAGFEVGGEPCSGAACIESLRGRLQSVKDGVRAGDWVAVGDVLGHDMDAEVDRWRGLLLMLADRARAG